MLMIYLKSCQQLKKLFINTIFQIFIFNDDLKGFLMSKLPPPVNNEFLRNGRKFKVERFNFLILIVEEEMRVFMPCARLEI